MGKAKKKSYLNEAANLKTTSTATRSQIPASSKSDKARQKRLSSSNDTTCKRVLEFFLKFHLWDFMSAPAVRSKLDWVTLSQYPLSPQSLYKRWQNKEEIVGVRFPSGQGKTSYFLLDVDSDSEYHPDCHQGNFASLLNGKVLFQSRCRDWVVGEDRHWLG